MFIAMSRFKIVRGHEDAFEQLWKKRDKHLNEVRGFQSFNLIKAEYYTLSASNTFWHSKVYFEKWTKSSNYQATHQNPSKNSNLYLAHPIFKGFDVVVQESSINYDSSGKQTN